MKKRILWAIPILIGIGASGLLTAGYSLCKSNNHPITEISGSEFQRVEIIGDDNKVTVAWLAAGTNDKGIIFAHGNSSDRNSMIPRMTYFRSMGYSVIAPDLNGHGETFGNRKTFGYLESKDIENSNRYLRSKLGLKWVAGIGASLGGASILKAESDGINLDAVIIESVFSDIRTAARNRLEMKFGKLGKYLEPLLTAQIPLWVGISREDISPAEWAQKCRAPILILSGDADERATPGESEAIFKHVPTPRKQINLFKGAKHVDLFAFNKAEYKKEITRFLMEIESDSASAKYSTGNPYSAGIGSGN